MKHIFISLILLISLSASAQRFSPPYVEITDGIIIFHAPIDAQPHHRIVPDCISDNTHVRYDIMLPPNFNVQAFRDKQEVLLHQYSQNLDTREDQESFITTYLLLIHINRGKTAEYQKEYAEALKILRKAKGVWIRNAMELVEEAEKRDLY